MIRYICANLLYRDGITQQNISGRATGACIIPYFYRNMIRCCFPGCLTELKVHSNQQIVWRRRCEGICFCFVGISVGSRNITVNTARVMNGIHHHVAGERIVQCVAGFVSSYRTNINVICLCIRVVAGAVCCGKRNRIEACSVILYSSGALQC